MTSDPSSYWQRANAMCSPPCLLLSASLSEAIGDKSTPDLERTGDLRSETIDEAWRIREQKIETLLRRSVERVYSAQQAEHEVGLLLQSTQRAISTSHEALRRSDEVIRNCRTLRAL